MRQKLPTIILFIILIIAAYLRLYQIENYMTFLGDEGRDVLVVKRMIVDHKFTLLGPTASVGGFFLGPIYYYLMLPFLWAWNLDPVGPAVMVGLFGVATVYVVYLTGKTFFGRSAGLIAASLYAVSPLVIAYSRSSWNPNVVPFFATSLIYMLWKLAQSKKVQYGFLIGCILGIGIQLHYLFLFLFGVVAGWYFLHKQILLKTKVVLHTLGGLLVGASPFLAFEVRHDFVNTRAIVQFLLAGKETGVATGYLSTILDVSYRTFGRLLYRLPQPEAWSVLPAWYTLALQVATISTLFLFVVYFVWTVLHKWKSSQTLLFLWFLIPLFLFGFYRKNIYDYYFGIFFAFPFLFAGLIASQAMRRVKWLVLSLYMALLIFNWQGRPFVHPPNNQLAQVRTIAQTAFEQAGGRPFNFALVTGGNSDHAFRYFFEIWGNPPVVIENTQSDPQRKSVTDQLIVICEEVTCEPLGHPLWEIAGFGRAEVAGSWDVPFVKIYRLVHYEEEK